MLSHCIISPFKRIFKRPGRKPTNLTEVVLGEVKEVT